MSTSVGFARKPTTEVVNIEYDERTMVLGPVQPRRQVRCRARTRAQKRRQRARRWRKRQGRLVLPELELGTNYVGGLRLAQKRRSRLAHPGFRGQHLGINFTTVLQTKGPQGPVHKRRIFPLPQLCDLGSSRNVPQFRNLPHLQAWRSPPHWWPERIQRPRIPLAAGGR